MNALLIKGGRVHVMAEWLKMHVKIQKSLFSKVWLSFKRAIYTYKETTDGAQVSSK